MNGLLSTTELAAYLRVRPVDVGRMVEEDGLPAVSLPGKARPVRKYSPMAVHRWLCARSSGAVLGLEDFLRELAMCRGEGSRSEE